VEMTQSASKSGVIGPEQPPVLVGERINPTGKRRLAAALVAGNLDIVRLSICGWQ